KDKIYFNFSQLIKNFALKHISVPISLLFDLYQLSR
ncbi:hypothetical protein ECP02989429_3349, partial [Escherichia coli P0298942.9]